MNLESFVSECGGKPAFAKKYGISVDYVRKLLRGDRRPGRDLADRIEHDSGGRVTRIKLIWGDAA